MSHSRHDGPLKNQDLELPYSIPHPHPGVGQRYSFRYCELPAMGTGPQGNLITSCDGYLNRSLVAEAYAEFLDNHHKVTDHFHHMMPFGLVPSELNGQKCLDSYLLNLDRYPSVEKLISDTNEMKSYHDVKNHVATKLGLNLPWKDVIHFKKVKSFFQKNDPADWNSAALHFPQLIRLVETLPFSSVGYVMIMRNNAGSKLDIHRDIFPRNHSCHHINIALDGKPRPFFIYDSVSKTKHYKDSSSLSYFFNEADLHGADASEWSSLTLRIDGVFEEDFAKAIGLKSGVTFNWSYSRPQEFIRNNGHIKVWNETDI